MRSPIDVNVYVTVGKSRDTKSLDQAPTILNPMWARTDLGCCSYSSTPLPKITSSVLKESFENNQYNFSRTLLNRPHLRHLQTHV